MSIKTGLLVLGGVAVVGTIAYAVTRKSAKAKRLRGVHIESDADRGVWDAWNSALADRWDGVHTWRLDEAKPGVERFAGKGDVVVLRIGAGPWLDSDGDLKPVSAVAAEVAATLRLMVANGAVIVAMPSVLPWTTALGKLPGAADKVSVLRRAAQMFDTWIRSQHSRPGFEGDGLFKAVVDVNAMKAADGMIDAQYVGTDGTLNAAGQARLTELVDAAIAEVA